MTVFSAWTGHAGGCRWMSWSFVAPDYLDGSPNRQPAKGKEGISPLSLSSAVPECIAKTLLSKICKKKLEKSELIL